ncbi:MAG: HAD-IA family hydrolase [Candidatus Coatesbacteria bacterium]|nr:HAD-IA family hydrolase [Candidatus Coatesbacteria bacterium]
MISLILFDVGWTLLKPRLKIGQFYSEFAIRYGIEVSGEDCQQAYLKIWKEVDSETPYGIDRFSYWGGARNFWTIIVSKTFSELGVDSLPEGFAEKLDDSFGNPDAWILYPDTISTLENLLARGIKLGIVSNWDSRLKSILRGNKLLDYFNPVIASASVGVEKPSIKIFEIALKDHPSIPKEEILYIGDDPLKDINGCKEAGIKPILIDRRGIHNKLQEIERIGSLSELLTKI